MEEKMEIFQVDNKHFKNVAKKVANLLPYYPVLVITDEYIKLMSINQFKISCSDKKITRKLLKRIDSIDDSKTLVAKQFPFGYAAIVNTNENIKKMLDEFIEEKNL